MTEMCKCENEVCIENGKHNFEFFIKLAHQKVWRAYILLAVQSRQLIVKNAKGSRVECPAIMK